MTVVKDPIIVDLEVFKSCFTYGNDTTYTVRVAIPFDEFPDLDDYFSKEDFFKDMDRALHLHPAYEETTEAVFHYDRHTWKVYRD